MNIYIEKVVDTWGVDKTIQVVVLSIASGAIAAFAASILIPNHPVVETIEKEN